MELCVCGMCVYVRVPGCPQRPEELEFQVADTEAGPTAVLWKSCTWPLPLSHLSSWAPIFFPVLFPLGIPHTLHKQDDLSTMSQMLYSPSVAQLEFQGR